MMSSAPPAMNSNGARSGFLKFTHVSCLPGLKFAISPYDQTQLPGAGIAYRSYAARDSASGRVLVNAYCHCSWVNPAAWCRFAGLFRIGNRDLICDGGLTRTPDRKRIRLN